MKSIIQIVCVFCSILLVASCGHSLTEKELTELETRAENGDVEAAIKLKDYYGSMPLNLSLVDYKELKEIAAHGDMDAKKKVKEYERINDSYDKYLALAADNGDPESAISIALDCQSSFLGGIDVKENKMKYRKYMEIAIASGKKVDGKETFIDDYKSLYQNQSEEWWESDSIKTKEGK